MTISADMIDEIYTMNSNDLEDSETLLAIFPADANRRPFVIFAHMEADAGTMDLFIGGRRILDISGDSKTREGLVVGNKNEAIAISTDATIGVKHYVITGGYLRIGPGEGKSLNKST